MGQCAGGAGKEKQPDPAADAVAPPHAAALFAPPLAATCVDVYGGVAPQGGRDGAQILLEQVLSWVQAVEQPPAPRQPRRGKRLPRSAPRPQSAVPAVPPAVHPQQHYLSHAATHSALRARSRASVTDGAADPSAAAPPTVSEVSVGALQSPSAAPSTEAASPPSDSAAAAAESAAPAPALEVPTLEAVDAWVLKQYKLVYATFEGQGWGPAEAEGWRARTALPAGQAAGVGEAAWDVRPILYAPFPPEVQAAADATAGALRQGLAAAVVGWAGDSDGTCAPSAALLSEYYAAAEGVVGDSIARASDTCTGPGRRTERAARARANLSAAFAAVREALPAAVGATAGKGRPGSVVDVFLAANKRIYEGILEAAVVPHHMGRPRSACELDVSAGPVKTFPHAHVDAALRHIDAYARAQAPLAEGADGVEVIARVYMALLSVHPCPDGNGRAAACVAAALAERYALPPPLFTKVTNRIIRAYNGQRPPLANMTPADALLLVVEAMQEYLGKVAAPAQQPPTSPG
eukprot:TRINITY_DN20960_c0_g1_i1.p1 TRINITY_DN20960_c0_g1~~TRINITY_DN20960_c0_g1_i1.p1  ORF type:complete len:521 (+),score=152.15 TRINITY_DN20960_c0_g1_i1:139-1701(+)